MTELSQAYEEPFEPPDSHLGALVNVAHDGVAVLDRLGMIRYISPANERHFARKPEEVIGHHISEFIHPGDLPEVQRRLEQDPRGDAETPLVFRSRQPDGRWRWFVAVMPRMDGHYVPDHFIFFIRDITRHRLIEQQYRMAERLGGCGVWRVDFDNPYPDLSPGMLHLFGFQPGDLAHKPKYWPLMRVHPSDAKTVLKTLRHAMNSPRVFSFCCRVRARDGSIKLLKSTGHVETNADGAGVAIIGVSHDITLISLAEQKLRDSEQKYRLLTERASDIVCQLSLDGKINFTSPSAERIIGQHPDTIVGQNFKSLIVEEDHATFDHFLSQLQRGNDDILCTVRAKRGDREGLWLELSGSPLTVPGDADSGFVCMVRDISERKKFEAELQEARLEAEEANKTKTRFLTSITHELRTPLNAILGFSELIRQQTFGSVGNARYKEYAKLIHESGTMLKTLINDLLDLSKIEAGKYELQLEQFKLKEIVPSCVRQITPQAMKKEITVTDRVSGTDIGIWADKLALTQVLINLLSNAVKFTPRGGRIELTARSDVERVWLRVHDTGIGIPKHDIDRITAPFEQAGKARKGTGLGLALAKSLVDLHGGELIINSEPGQGTTVSVVLPAGAACKAVA